MVVIERYCWHCGAAGLATAAACAVCGVSFKATLPLEDKEPALAAASLRLPEHLHTRQLFRERYRIVRQVGAGGFGAVYEVEDTLEQRRVAIKEIGLAGLSAQQTIEVTSSFNREVQMLSSLSHPGIPRMYEQLTDAEHWYLVMEFIAGETLEALLARGDDGRLPLEQVLRLGAQICDVLSYLHSQQPAVIFRDLKPANIMLTPEERLYLIDFGVARFYKPDKLRDTIAFGSPGYASPEQYGRAQTTPRADIYSLGALLHQLLTGVDPSLDPFHFQSLRAYNHSLPRALEKLVAQMLEYDRELRPTSSTEVGHQLRSIAASPSVLQRHRAANPAQGGQAPARTILPAFSTLGVPVFRYHGHKGSVTRLAWSPDGSVLASLEYEQALHIWQAFQAAPATIAHPQARDLAWSPDGRVLALAGSDHVVRLWHVGQHPHWWRMAALSLGFLADIYERHTSPVEALCWSPDGQQIASLETNGSIHIWQARTRACLLVYPGHADVGEDLAWSPDGTRLASCGIDQVVRVWRATDGESRWRWRVKGSIVHTLAWSPDSHYLACGASDSTVHVWDFTHNRRVFIYRAHKKGSIKALAWSPDGQRIASASSDGTVHVWGALTGGHAFRYHEHRECVGAVAWSPDGQHIASASSDAEVHIWKTV